MADFNTKNTAKNLGNYTLSAGTQNITTGKGILGSNDGRNLDNFYAETQ